MERRIKEELVKYYEAPKPKRKQAFVRQFGVPKMNLGYLTILQIRYISKWAWLCSAFFVMITYSMVCTVDEKFARVVFALIPFWVMVSVTESMRSYRYGMEELELSTRFSLKSIVMARLLVLGIANLAVMAVLTGVMRTTTDFHILHVMAPYFLTAGGGLYIVRKIRGSENTLYCFGLAALICVWELILQWNYQELFLQKYTLVWAVVCMAGVLLTVRESYRTIRMTEDLAWN